MNNPLEIELAWERIWNYSTLDAISALQSQLYIPGDLQVLRNTCLDVLADHYAAYEFGTAPGFLCLKVAGSLESVLGELDALRFICWGDYLSDLVVSRVGEFFWTSVLYGLEEVEHSTWLAERATGIRAEMDSSFDHLDDQLETLQFSPRDEIVLQRVRRSKESMRSYFKKVVRYNLFARAWHRNMAGATLDQLNQTYLTGKQLAAKRNVDETAVCFPEFWSCGPQRALLNLI